MNKGHKVLIIDDEFMIGRIIVGLLDTIGVSSVYVSSAKEGIEELEKSSQTFALIIADQKMPVMNGTEFFEQASVIAPDAIRFLITGYSDIHVMINAVNRGAIHKYIAKPWQNDDFLESIKEGLEQYDLAIENSRLFRLAKQQNTKLFELNRILNDSAKKQTIALKTLDARIEDELRLRIEKKEDFDILKQQIKELMQEQNMLEYTKANKLYDSLLNELAHRFMKKSKL